MSYRYWQYNSGRLKDLIKLQELQSTSASLADAKQSEADALKRYSHLKRNLGAIEGIVKSARSPSASNTSHDRISR